MNTREICLWVILIVLLLVGIHQDGTIHEQAKLIHAFSSDPACMHIPESK